MRLVKTGEQWAAAAALFAEGRYAVCEEVFTPLYLDTLTPENCRAELLEEKRGGWAFYLHYTAGQADGMVGGLPQDRADHPPVCDVRSPGEGHRRQNAGICPQKAAGTPPPDADGAQHEHPGAGPLPPPEVAPRRAWRRSTTRRRTRPPPSIRKNGGCGTKGKASWLLSSIYKNVENKLVNVHKGKSALLAELQNPAKFANFYCTKSTK